MKYKLCWFRNWGVVLKRTMFGIETWQDYFLYNEWLGIIFGRIFYLIAVICASPVTFILSIVFNVLQAKLAKQKIREGNEDFIKRALKYKLIKEIK